MSQLQIDQVLAQIRGYSGHGAAVTRPVAPGAAGAAAAAIGGLAATGATGPAAFGQMLQQGIEAVNRSQQTAATLADAYERGTSGVDLAQVMLETQKASVSFRALTEVRNRLVNVYQEIMNMPI
jgi:flagellar hook-basal body complex protein FliE